MHEQRAFWSSTTKRTSAALIEEILSEEGYDVRRRRRRRAGARCAQSSTSPTVLLDIWMPDTDGITLLREWAERTARPCPVVMMSGHGTVETAVEATRLGAFDFIEKPLSLAKLLRTVEKRALDAARSERRRHARIAPTMLRRSARAADARAARADRAASPSTTRTC